MTDQDDIYRFPDGEPIKLTKPERAWRRVGEILLTWLVVMAVLIGMFWLMFSLVSEQRAHADESAARIFERDGECSIDADLRVAGAKRGVCVEKLETAARLARAEMRVNEPRRRR